MVMFTGISKQGLNLQKDLICGPYDVYGSLPRMVRGDHRCNCF